MKNIGLALLIIGIGLSAAYGSKNSDAIHENNIHDGQATFFGAQAEELREAYCEALAAGNLVHEADCPADEEPAEEPAEEATEEPADDAAADEEAAEDVAEEPAPELPTYEEALAAETAAFEAIRDAGPPNLAPEVQTARDAWTDALARTVEPKARLASAPLAEPRARLSNWFGTSGVPFSVGIFLVIIGAVMARKAAGAAGDQSTDDEGKPVDFGQLLGELANETTALAETMRADPGMARGDEFKKTIEALHRDKIERLVGARIALQRKHGLAIYAAIFSPLSNGERLLNRAWAALSDAHFPEALNSVTAAAESLRAAKAEIPAAS